MDKIELELLVKEVYDVYQVDLSTKQDLKNEVQKWVYKCSCSLVKQLATIRFLKNSKKYFYPNLFNLFKNFTILPI